MFDGDFLNYSDKINLKDKNLTKPLKLNEK